MVGPALDYSHTKTNYILNMFKAGVCLIGIPRLESMVPLPWKLRNILVFVQSNAHARAHAHTSSTHKYMFKVRIF